MSSPCLNRLPLAGLLLPVALMLSLSAGCGAEQGGSAAGGGGAAPGTTVQKVTPSDRVYTVEDLEAAGLKTLHHYDVSGLPEAVDAWHLSFKPEGKYLEYEARFYSSHNDAVTHGTAWAETGAGETAVIIGDDVWWSEGQTHRRKCSRAAETPHSGCAYSPLYGDFIILGNMILMCEGPNSQEALHACRGVLAELQ